LLSIDTLSKNQLFLGIYFADKYLNISSKKFKSMETTKNKELLSGNEAIARGAMEAGISLAVSYPGTPATEILEYLARHYKGKAEWAVNEKIAYETAVGVSYTGKRALCSMKHVGLNVASDPLMTSSYLGIKGGLVLVVADDPGAFSSQNEQDSRYFARFAKIPCLEPADAQEAKDLTLIGFSLSESIGLPVMIRSVTRISHTSSPVKIGTPRKENPVSLEKDPKNMIAVPSNVGRLHKNLNLKQEDLIRFERDSNFNKSYKDGQKKGIIGCGIGSAYGKEYGSDFALLKISYYPFSDELIKNFVEGLEEIWVLEEGETHRGRNRSMVCTESSQRKTVRAYTTGRRIGS
jgi:indolepyruvate ferredoxin oxidoreductase, alpha subunit